MAVLLAGVLLTGSSCAGGADTPPAGGAGSTAITPAPEGAQDGDPSTQAFRESQVVRTDYRTQYQGETIDKHALVYLPPGYDQQDAASRYDIVYLMHGAGMTADSLLGGPGQSSTLADLLDRMMGDEKIPPMIVVTPTFYPDDNASTDLHYAGELDRLFPRELENDLMPAIETRYRTYAPTADAAGFQASRDHRAFSGFSMGGVTTWYTFLANLDLFRYFGPMAGDSWVVQDTGGARAPEETAARLDQAARDSGYRKNDYLIVASVGSADGTRYQMEPQIRAMRQFAQSFDSGNDGNLRYVLDDGGGHDLDSLHAQLSTSLRVFFRS